jgi:3-phosphoshikimate 1-carboxyvinyltransferase
MSDALAIEPLEHPPDAAVAVPGSKSITNRVLPLAAIATGRSVVRNVGEGDDVEAMLDALGALGVTVDLDDDRTATVEGTGGLLPATTHTPGEQADDVDDPRPVIVDGRQSGTTTRFLLAMAAGAGAPITITAHPQMRGRPLTDGITAIRQAGATVTSEGVDATLPLTVVPASPGPAVEVTVRGDASSQFLSGLLLSGPLHPGGLTVTVTGELVSRPYVDMTIAVLASFGVAVTGEGEHRFVIPPGSQASGTELTVEPDASSASYFFGAAAITGGRVTVSGLGTASLQGDLEFVGLLEAMGATVTIGADATTVTGPPPGHRLRGIDADLAALSDTVPTLAAVAAFAEGPTRIGGVGFIRHKESDRIGNVVAELRRAGVAATETDDGMVIDPGGGELHAATLATHDDHRLAMAFSLLGLRTPGIAVADPGCVAKTYPSYWEHLATLHA